MILLTGAKSGLGRYIADNLPCKELNKGDPLPEGYFETIIHCGSDRENPILDIEFTKRLLGVPHKYFIYTSTVDVYKALRGEPNQYAHAKLECEKVIRNYSDNYCILRLSMMIGKDAKPNSVMKILKGEPVTLSPESMVSVIQHEDVCKLIEQLLFIKAEYGTMNVTACGRITLGEAFPKARFGSYTYISPDIPTDTSLHLPPKTSLDAINSYENSNNSSS